jgi:hypothetical protein
MNKILAGCIGLSLVAGMTQASAQSFSDKALDDLYERGQREMAPNWRGLGKTRESAVFIHEDIRKADNGVLAVWMHHELPAPGYIEKEKPYLSTRDRMLVDCKGSRTGISDVAYYAERFGFGAVVWTVRRKPELAEVVPDSIEALLVKVVCESKPSKGKAAKKAKTAPPSKEKEE